MQRRVFVGLAVVVVVLVAGAFFPASSATTGEAGQHAQEPPQLSTLDGFNNTVFEIVVYENASARWMITHSRVLENSTEREQFESFAAEFNSTETAAYENFKARAQALTDYGTDATGRQMNATDFSKEATVEPRFRTFGVVRMSFTWTNFAQTTDDRVVVDDVFQGGMFIDEQQRLVVAHGPNLVFDDVSPTPDRMDVEGNLTASQSVEWTGRQEFEDERPKVVLVQPGEATGEVESTTQTPVAAGPASGSFGPVPILVAVVLLLVLGACIAWYTGGLDGILHRGGGTDVGSETTVDNGEAPPAQEAEPEPAVPEEELLSDEDRVLKLLEENGGRMKQVNIVEETEWSKSKVSMLLSDMEDEGLISKLRVGRENIISKAGEEPDAVGSPFEDE